MDGLMILRGIALFFSSLLLFDVLLGVEHRWFDFRPLPTLVGAFFELAGALCGIAWVVWPGMRRWRRDLTLGTLAVLSIVAVLNSARFYGLLARGSIITPLPIPLSLVAALALIVMGLTFLRDKPQLVTLRRAPVLVATLVGCAIVTPLLQMSFFGNTDYRRRADVAVVFGARAYADGRASDALSDRVRAACELYREGLVTHLIFSGGPGDGAVHETESMRNLAVTLGVPESAITLDRDGVNTAATVRNSARIVEELRAPRVLAVSHFYHLPRIKLEFQRAGLEVFTVPSPQRRPLNKLPLLVAREVAAIWRYYLPL
jgi:vancomycin permeability regulator SanA